MRAFTAAAITLLLSGCMTSRGAWEARAWSPELAAEVPFDEAEFALKDGRVARLKDIGDHGYAFCGQNGCVRKTDIVTVTYRDSYQDVVGTMVAAPIVAAPLAVLGVICLINCNFNGTPYKMTGKEPVLTAEQAERTWLDGLRIKEGRIIGTEENACVGDKPTAVGRDFATDVEAFEWIIANRNQVSLECLEQMTRFGRALAGPDGAQKTQLGQMQATAVYQVRWKWNIDRCVMTSQNDYMKRQSTTPVSPLNHFTFGDRRGNPDALRVLEETLANPAIYVYEGDLPRVCMQGILPKDQWPDLQTWIPAHSPFAVAP
jgi:hypothetical protein